MTMGHDQRLLERHRILAASSTICSMAGRMKSKNWISTTGRMPLKAAPMERPTIAVSASGESITRSSPNSAWRPAVVRKTPPWAPMSSPIMKTRSSARISSARASCTASRTLLIGIDVLQRVFRHRVRRLPGEIGGVLNLTGNFFGKGLVLGLIQHIHLHQRPPEDRHRVIGVLEALE